MDSICRNVWDDANKIEIVKNKKSNALCCNADPSHNVIYEVYIINIAPVYVWWLKCVSEQIIFDTNNIWFRFKYISI